MPRTPSAWQERVAERSRRNSLAGQLGNAAMRAKYPKPTQLKWARTGGRPRDLTLAEIEAQEGAR